MVNWLFVSVVVSWLSKSSLPLIKTLNCWRCQRWAMNSWQHLAMITKWLHQLRSIQMQNFRCIKQGNLTILVDHQSLFLKQEVYRTIKWMELKGKLLFSTRLTTSDESKRYNELCIWNLVKLIFIPLRNWLFISSIRGYNILIYKFYYKYFSY